MSNEMIERKTQGARAVLINNENHLKSKCDWHPPKLKILDAENTSYGSGLYVDDGTWWSS